MKLKLTLLLSVLAIMFLFTNTAFADYADGEECWACGHYHYDDYMCSDCGACSAECSNGDCYEATHCANCGECFLTAQIWCEDCLFCEDCYVNDLKHCLFCNNCSESGYDVCEECGACEDCWVSLETHCLYCGECYEGREDEALCKTCFACESCAGDICEYCGDCEDCAVFAKEHHCPECGNCYDNVEQCETGAEHCQECCVLCEECGECFFDEGGELCEYCGLCLDCCRNAAEALDCSCGDFCVESSDWEEHTCFECGIPFCSVEQCEICELCLECCESNSDCSDGMCAQDPDYEEHFCEDCGQCFHDVDRCEDCYDKQELRCVECCNDLKGVEGSHKAKPKNTWDYNETNHYHACAYCNETSHYTGTATHTFNADGICTVCGYNNGSKSIITVQPKSQTCTVSDVVYGDENSPLSPKNNKVTFTIQAKDAKSYHWYYKYDNSKWFSIADDEDSEGATTNTVKFSVPSDGCNSDYSVKCVVTGNDGKEYESNIARLICKHAFDYSYGQNVIGREYYDLHFSNNTHVVLHESQGHKIVCLGEGCEKSITSILPHEYNPEPEVRTEKNGTLWNTYLCKICGRRLYVKQSEDTMKTQFEKQPIKQITAIEVKDINEPKAGNAPDYVGTLGSSEYLFKKFTSEFYENGITWYDITDQKDVPVKDGKFIEGHSYKVKISLNSAPGYEFTKATTGKISGKTATVLVQDNQVVISVTWNYSQNTYTANEVTLEEKQAQNEEKKKPLNDEETKEKAKEILDQIANGEKVVKPAEGKSGDSKPVGSNSGDKNTQQQGANQTQETIHWTKASEWALDELTKANELNVIPKIFDKQDLTKNITRKEFAHVAVKLYEKLTGNKATKAEKNPFNDTKDEEVLKAYNVGITNGVSENQFAPDNLITREQMATMMTRALTKVGINTEVNLDKVSKFADDGEMHDWGRASIYYMSSIEIIKGVGENRFNVLGNATREQALLISERSAEKLGHK